jgi:predicted amidophosphoribosyltransferase
MPEPTSATLCSCCKREIPTDEPKGRCWECRGRPPVYGHVKRLAGERASSCPHAVPSSREPGQ